jgi:hypothetical protein
VESEAKGKESDSDIISDSSSEEENAEFLDVHVTVDKEVKI